MEETMAFRRITIVSGSSLFAASLWLTAGVLPRSAAAEIPGPVRQALESNARSLSPITVAWELTRTSDLPRPRVLSLTRSRSSLFLPQQSRIMWDNERFATHTVTRSYGLDTQPNGPSTELTDGPLSTAEVDVTFDGEKRYSRTKTDSAGTSGILIIDRPTHHITNKRNVRYLNADFLKHAGFHIPERAEDYEAKQPAKSLPLYLVEQGASVIEVGREEVDGVSGTVLVLRSATAEYRFVLDPAKGYAVRRRVEKTLSGEVAVRADCSDFTQLPGSGLWMPRKVEVEWHTWLQVLVKPVKEAVVRETYRVSELKSEPIPLAQFVLKPDQPGTDVADSTIEGRTDSQGRVNYVVPADPSRLDEVIRAAASGNAPERTIWWIRRNFILANVLLILVLSGAVWWRARRKSR
jgi:hypothetical protein